MVGEKMLGRFIIPRPQPAKVRRVEKILSNRFGQKDIESFINSAYARAPKKMSSHVIRLVLTGFHYIL